MLFASWIIFWIFTAKTFPMLVVPALAYVVRASYLDRPVLERMHCIPLVSGTLLFIVLLITSPDRAVAPNGLLATKLVASSIVLIHVMRGTKTLNISLLGRQPAVLLVSVQRALSVEVQMFSNLFYAFRVRWASPAVSVREKMQLIGGLIASAFLELLQLGEDVSQLQRVRGGSMFSTGWVLPHRQHVPIILGDAGLLLLVCTGAMQLPVTLVPEPFRLLAL